MPSFRAASPMQRKSHMRHNCGSGTPAPGVGGPVGAAISLARFYLGRAAKKSRGWGGGASRNRTDDLYNAIVALSQLSYGPECLFAAGWVLSGAVAG